MGKLYSNFSRANKLLDGNISIYLDLVRGISAILVVMTHLSSRLFVGYGNLENHNIFVKFLYLLNLLGSPAVIVFFVLSGLFISRSILKAVFENNWSWRTYLINRFSRLLIVLIPALLFTLVLDSIATNFFEFKGYESIFHNFIEFIGNLFFLQGIFVKYYGSNAPLWSLSYEFWYYMLFPILICIFFNKRGKIHIFLYVLLSLVIVSNIGIEMISYFFIWLIGPFVLFLPRINFLTNKLLPIVALILVSIAVIIHPLAVTGRLLFIDRELKELMDLLGVNITIGLTFGFLTYTLLHSVSGKLRNIEIGHLGKVAKLISSISFSLYIIHYPIINTVYFLCAQYGFSGLQPNLFSVIAEIVIVIIICFIAYVFSYFTEAKTHIVRKFLLSRTSKFFVTRRDNELSKQTKVM
ncbi:acyltransferase [Bacillus sp. JJ1533]|uniref:acyltransferase family protein n=1 Tax=Bacillus sp. JJ1533 TaxID=3122959 RepID=UPI003000C9D2